MNQQDTDTTNKMKTFFHNDRFADFCRVSFDEVCDEYAVCSVEITPNTLNADGFVQGGLIFTLADLTFSALANHLHPRTVTQFASISYVNPAVGKKLIAKAVELSRTRHNATYSITVTNDEGLIIATMHAAGFINALN